MKDGGVEEGVPPEAGLHVGVGYVAEIDLVLLVLDLSYSVSCPISAVDAPQRPSMFVQLARNGISGLVATVKIDIVSSGVRPPKLLPFPKQVWVEAVVAGAGRRRDNSG